MQQGFDEMALIALCAEVDRPWGGKTSSGPLETAFPSGEPWF
jgi:hypothetical protein